MLGLFFCPFFNEEGPNMYKIFKKQTLLLLMTANLPNFVDMLVIRTNQLLVFALALNYPTHSLNFHYIL